MINTVSRNGGRNIRRFEGYDDVVKPAFAQQRYVFVRAFGQCQSGRSAVADEQFFFQRAGVDADTDGNVMVLCAAGNLLDVPAADIARIDSDFIRALADTFQRQPVIEMNIGHQRDGKTALELAKPFGGQLVRNGNAQNFTAGLL